MQSMGMYNLKLVTTFPFFYHHELESLAFSNFELILEFSDKEQSILRSLHTQGNISQENTDIDEQTFLDWNSNPCFLLSERSETHLRTLFHIHSVSPIIITNHSLLHNL
jgi:hypothetical protein